MPKRRILKARDIQLGGRARTPGRDPEPHDDTACQGEIEVVLRRSGDLIEAIEVVCPCGRRTEVECLYDALETANGGLPESAIEG